MKSEALKSTFIIRFLFLLVLSFGLPATAYALASSTEGDDAVHVRLISGIEGVGQEKTVPLGLDVTLADGWHTYWRSPGEAGLPPSIDWKDSLSDAGNLKAATLRYPAPQRHVAFGLETIGYSDHVVFPIDADLRAPGKPLALEGEVELLVCSSICVPKSFTLKLDVPAGPAKEAAEAGLLKQFRDKVPTDGDSSGLLVKSIVNDGESLTFHVESNETLTQPDIFIEDDRNVSFAAPLVTFSPDRLSATLKAKPADNLPENTSLSDLHLTLTVIDGDRAVEQHMAAPPMTAAAPLPAMPPPLPLILAVFFAIIGGLILNLMPCVLPVLSLKIISVIGHGGGEARLVRQSFLVSAAGILFSFLILGAVMAGLKTLGLSFGWGVQFQQPLFLIFLVLLLTFFAANMWGLLEFHLPRFLADQLGDAGYHPKLAGDFAAGAFATLLATPCSAPFLGTAIGFALASGPRDIMIVFASLGGGMILPYLAIAAFPALATALPKPGAWMATLRRLLGAALAITAVWLLWVLSAQITPRFAFVVSLCMAAILLLLGFSKTSVSRWIVRFGLGSFILLALALTTSGMRLPRTAAELGGSWQPFSEMALAANLAEGNTVFVDVTANWCLTCKANKHFVLSQGEVAQRLFHSDVVVMQADWTNPDPAIADFLHKYGRYGIPFNAAFGPGAPQGIVLPELLTPDVVMNALDTASRQ